MERRIHRPGAPVAVVSDARHRQLAAATSFRPPAAIMEPALTLDWARSEIFTGDRALTLSPREIIWHSAFQLSMEDSQSSPSCTPAPIPALRPFDDLLPVILAAASSCLLARFIPLQYSKDQESIYPNTFNYLAAV